MVRVGVLLYTQHTDISIYLQSSESLHLTLQLMDYGYDKPEPGVVSIDSILPSFMDDNLLHPEEKRESGLVLKRYSFGWIAGLIVISVTL